MKEDDTDDMVNTACLDASAYHSSTPHSYLACPVPPLSRYRYQTLDFTGFVISSGNNVVVGTVFPATYSTMPEEKKEKEEEERGVEEEELRRGGRKERNKKRRASWVKHSRDVNKGTKEQKGTKGGGEVGVDEKRKGMVKKVVSTPPPGAAFRDLTAEAPRPRTTLSCGAAGGTEKTQRRSGIMTTAAATLCASLGEEKKAAMLPCTCLPVIIFRGASRRLPRRRHWVKQTHRSPALSPILDVNPLRLSSLPQPLPASFSRLPPHWCCHFALP
ncbi:hypothetical protein E2C01_078636 [Portunus trituberculatus]|uniref:Uncharacterized protein n=1 Tax=Portunus trituberculatus TaxID=210409 RepID=A0A5B7IUN0_PORTR|nr:hypothetical protein [Portunus trituberculatus]